ncbi:MAG: tetratricopeptide repeat protein [Armatimonadota bacterium]
MSDESVLDEENLQAQVDELRALWEAGQWREARSQLLQLRRQRGDLPVLLTALGDCHAAGGHWADAVRWYEESLARCYDPDLVARLDEARSQLGGPGRGGAARLWMYGAAAALVLVLIALGVTAYLWLAGSRPPARPVGAGEPVPAVPRAPHGVEGRTTQSMPGPSTTGPSAAPSRPVFQGQRTVTSAHPPTGPSPAALPPIKVTKTVEAPATDDDHFLTSLLGALSWPDDTPLTGDGFVQFDPYPGYAFVTLQIPRALPSQDLLKVVLDTAYGVAVSLMKGSPAVRFVTVRALYTFAPADEKARTVVAFRGNTSRESIEYWGRIKRRPSHEEIWYQVFAACWWNPEVPVQSGGRSDNRK